MINCGINQTMTIVLVFVVAGAMAIVFEEVEVGTFIWLLKMYFHNIMITILNPFYILPRF
jgi:hypothetical protein